jgi:hypothetical protein
MSKPVIYIFLPYFGKFPNYFQLYLDSVAMNYDILRIILITDIDISSYTVPLNVIHVPMTLENVRERICKFIQTEYNKQVSTSEILKRPYKLCEFKLINHILFKDTLDTIGVTPDDYVGWGDCDLIYGKLSKLIDVSEGYDLIGSKGHFTVFKYGNTICNTFYKQLDKYLDCMIEDYYNYSDENQLHTVIIPLITTSKIKYYELGFDYCDILPHNFLKKENEFKELTLAGSRLILSHLEFNASKESLVAYFKDGTQRNTSYVHLQKRPMTIEFDSYTSYFYITSNQFVITLPKADLNA